MDTYTIAAKIYNLRCQFRCSKSHPQHTIENIIAEAHSTLMISSTYPGPPSMPRSITLAKPKNKGKSYTTFLKPIVSAEWLRQIRMKYPHTPQPPTGNVFSRLHAQFLLHHLSLQPIQTPSIPHNAWAPQPHVSPQTSVPKPPIHSHLHAHH